MKLVFDDGSEQEIDPEDFHKIIRNSKSVSGKKNHEYLRASEKYFDKDEYELSLMYMQWADREARIRNICSIIEHLYFR